MANVNFEDDARGRLRTIVAALDHAISRLPPAGEGQETSTEVRATWKELVTALALEPAPATRECPVCKSIGMRAASRCGKCWTALEPLAPLPVTTATTHKMEKQS